MFKTIISVSAFGAAGALLRYWINQWSVRLGGSAFPFGTLFSNLLGCLMIGFFMQATLHLSFISPSLRLAIAVGFLGSLTTFSTFSYETIHLADRGDWLPALTNVMSNLFLGLLLTVAGFCLARWIFGTPT